MSQEGGGIIMIMGLLLYIIAFYCILFLSIQHIAAIQNKLFDLMRFRFILLNMNLNVNLMIMPSLCCDVFPVGCWVGSITLTYLIRQYLQPLVCEGREGSTYMQFYCFNDTVATADSAREDDSCISNKRWWRQWRLILTLAHYRLPICSDCCCKKCAASAAVNSVVWDHAEWCSRINAAAQHSVNCKTCAVRLIKTG